MYRVYSNQAAAAYSSLYFSFFFPSNFQISVFFATLFSETVKPIYLKRFTQLDYEWMYHVYCHQDAAAYLSLYFFVFLSLKYLNI